MEETTPEAVVQNTETPAATTPEKKADKTPGNIQGVLAYVPFLFIIAALQKLDDDTLMFHAKNGAGLTLLFIVASFVSAWISVLFGSIISLIWLIPSILGAFHGYKNVEHISNDDLLIEKCDFLKLDCEGAEYEIIELLSKNYLQKIEKTVIEYHMFDTQPDLLKKLQNTLENNSFELKTRSLFSDIGFLFALKK